MPALLLLSALLAVPCLARAEPSSPRVENAWSRAAMQGRTGVVYLTVQDDAGSDRLMGVGSPVAAKAEVHESFTDGGIAKMRAVAGLPVEQGKPLTLAPGGYHIMLMNLKQSLKQGDVFPITLTFEKAGAVAAEVTVRTGMPTPPDHMGATGMHPGGMPRHDGRPMNSKPE